MGKFGSPQIGVFSPDGNNYDNPNLNKCPNCGALFDGTTCPICKTVCADRRLKQAAVPQTVIVRQKAKKPVALIIFFVLSILLNIALSVILYGAVLLYADQRGENDSLQAKLTSAEHNAETIRQQLADVRHEYADFKKDADSFSQLDEAQKAAAIAQAEAEKAFAEAERAKADADKLAAQKELDAKQLEQNRRATEGVLVHEDEDVCIRFLAIEKATGWTSEHEAVFLVENKTDSELTIQCSSLSFDGIAVDGYLSCSDSIPPQSKGKARVGCESLNMMTPSIISGKLSVIDFSKPITQKRSYDVTFVNVNLK